MARNKPYGDNRRIGAVKNRSQFKHTNGHWIKRGIGGKFMSVKTDNDPFKGVIKEK